jgi:hypothetical protein
VRCCVHMGRRSVRWLGSARAAPDTPANIPSLQLSVPGSARPTKVQLRLAACATIFVLPMETQNRPTSPALHKVRRATRICRQHACRSSLPSRSTDAGSKAVGSSLRAGR